MRYALIDHSVRFAPTNREHASLICHSDPSVSLVLHRGGVFAISSYEQKATGAAHAFQVVRDLPYSAVDAFAYREPVAVSAQSFLSQLF